MTDRTQCTFAELMEKVDFIEVPILQRDYAQGSDASADIREAFLDSLHAALSDGARPLDLDFVYGSIPAGQTRTFALLDGQQRLTTLFLLHWYLALVEGEMEDFRRRWLAHAQRRSRFSYATRPSATEFFDALAERPLAVPAVGVRISEALRNERWFFDAWLRDPTVRSACGMLDAIERRFSATRGAYAALVSGRRISFHFLELSNFGLSDDLYIKMNARGKALTPFENLKAWLVGRVASAPWAHQFETRLDQQWTDFFWGIAGRGASKDQARFDELFLRFFHLVAFLQAAEAMQGSYYAQPLEAKNWIARLSNLPDQLALRELEAKGALDVAALQDAMRSLDWFSGPEGADHVELLVEVLKRPRYEDLLKVHALISFRREVDRELPDATAVPAHLDAWLRVTKNLIANSRFDDPGAAVHAIKALSTLSAYSLDLYLQLQGGVPGIAGFPPEQVEEEARKAALIVADATWEPLLRDAEEHWYLQGRIRSLLNYATEPGSQLPGQEAFCKYAAVAETVLTRENLESEAFLVQRALLSLYDFMPVLGSNRTFCVANATTYRSRSENWLPVIEDPRFRQLLDAVAEGGQQALQRLIDSGKATDWRMHAVEDEGLLGYCLLRMVRHTADGNVLLLSKQRLTGRWTELRTFALARELDRRHKGGGLPDTTSVEHRPTFEDGWPELVVQCGSTYRISWRNGGWHCTNEAGEDTPLPEGIGLIAAKYA